MQNLITIGLNGFISFHALYTEEYLWVTFEPHKSHERVSRDEAVQWLKVHLQFGEGGLWRAMQRITTKTSTWLLVFFIILWMMSFSKTLFVTIPVLIKYCTSSIYTFGINIQKFLLYFLFLISFNKQRAWEQKDSYKNIEMKKKGEKMAHKVRRNRAEWR